MSHQSENRTPDNSVVTRRTVIIFGVCICVILGFSQIDPIKNAVSSVLGILSPVFVGVMMAYIINPLEMIFEKLISRALPKKMSSSRRKSVSRWFGIFLALLVLIAVIVLLLFLIIPEFLQSLARLIEMAPQIFNNVIEWFNNHGQSALIESFGENIGVVFDTISGWIGGGVSSAVSGLWESVVSFFNFVVNFFVSIVICVYALVEKEKFIAQCKKLIFAMFTPARANDILDVARYSNDMFGKFLSGKILTSAIVGIVTFLFMTIMKIEYPLLSAGVVAITNVIPYFGPFIGGIPTALLILLTDFRQGVIYVIFLIILQQIEGNVIEPLIMEDKTGVSKFWITFALLVCGGIFGVVGMIFSVPIFAVLFYVIKIAVERSLTRKSMPLDSNIYLEAGSFDTETGTLVPAPQKPPRKKVSSVIKEWRERRKNKNDE